MFKNLSRLFCVLGLAVAAQSQAFTVVQADAFASGDGKAIRDTSSGLTWLDFGITNNQSYNQTVSQLGTTYTGWRLPTEAEVKDLWSNLFSDAANWQQNYFGAGWSLLMENSNIVSTAQNIFGINNVISYDDWAGASHVVSFSLGWFKGNDGTLKYASMTDEKIDSLGIEASFTQVFGPNVSYNDYLDAAYKEHSTLLVKETNVPEPSSIMLIGLGLLGLTAARRRAK